MVTIVASSVGSLAGLVETTVTEFCPAVFARFAGRVAPVHDYE